VGRPEAFPSDINGDWTCAIAGQTPDETVKRRGGGVDALQALKNALSLMKLELEQLECVYRDRVTFCDEARLWRAIRLLRRQLGRQRTGLGGRKRRDPSASLGMTAVRRSCFYGVGVVVVGTHHQIPRLRSG
jgi:hypothetical protein